MLERELHAVNDQRHALLMRLVSAQEVERRRIAADNHDDAVQVMTAAKMRLDLLSRHLDDRQGEAARQLSGTVALAIRRLRHLLFELTPPALEEHGLGTALRVLLEQSTEDTAIAWHLDCHLAAEPDRDAAVITYRVAQEAVVNVRKHSKARLVTVRVAHEDGGLRVRIADDGVGFSARTVGAAPGHLGLASMRERAQMAGGWLTLSSAPGSGTRIDFWVPAALSSPEDEERELQLSEMAG